MPDLQTIASFSDSFLAELPASGSYFSIAKILIFFACVILWGHTASWVPADTKLIRVPQTMWVSLIFASGVVSFLAWMFIPNFWIGFIIYAVIFGGASIGYVVYRNGRVGPGQTVLTPAHLKRLGKKEGQVLEIAQSQDRVRIKDANGKTPPWPKDSDERAAFSAMQDLLFDAIWRRASDLRLDLTAQQPVKVVYRVDGVDRAREPVDAAMGPRLFAHLKRIAGMNPEEHRKPQAGRFRGAIGAGGHGDRTVEIEARTSGSTSGERFIFRLVAEESKFRLTDIGLSAQQLAALQEMVSGPKGLVLVSGPKDSGVSSTLYAMLRQHDAFLQNVHTLEVNKDQDVDNITQHVFDSQGGTVTFGKRFKSILRTEPDVCMASDMVDEETAQLAAQSAKQGKKIYMGVAANDSFAALQVYLQRVGDPAMAAAGLLGITNQRLVRILCTNCRKGYKPDPAILKKANLPLGENRPFYRPPNPNELEVDKQGNPIPCAVCQGSGYLGRSAVFEVLVMNDDLRALLSKGAPVGTIKTEARKKGMLYMQEVALHKVYEGVTSINEVLRVTREGKPAAPVAAAG